VLPRYFLKPAEQVSDTRPIWVRSGYDAGAYPIRHMEYPIILIGQIDRYGHGYGMIRPRYGITHSDTAGFGHIRCRMGGATYNLPEETPHHIH
jgi:hypothetical protein